MNKIFCFTVSIVVASCSSPVGEKKKEISKQDSSEKISFSADSMGAPILNGEYVKKYDNGIIEMKGDYKNGKRNGTWQSWYPTGKQWSETNFKMGVKEGPTVTFYENGMTRYRGFYKNDERSGTWKLFSEDGKLQKEVDHDKEKK